MSDNAPTGIVQISAEIASRVNSALADGLPMLVAYVNADETPKMSFRGSVHVDAAGKLAFWARKAEGGVVDGIEHNAKLTLLYRDPASRTTLFFYGKAHRAKKQENIDRVYNESPEPERNADPEKKGAAIVVDLDLVQGRTPDGPVNLERS